MKVQISSNLFLLWQPFMWKGKEMLLLLTVCRIVPQSKAERKMIACGICACCITYIFHQLLNQTCPVLSGVFLVANTYLDGNALNNVLNIPNSGDTKCLIKLSMAVRKIVQEGAFALCILSSKYGYYLEKTY